MSYFEVGSVLFMAFVLWILGGATYSVTVENYSRDNTLEVKILTTVWVVVILFAFTIFACWHQGQGINPFISSESTNISVRES